jgi:hypothetical protein
MEVVYMKYRSNVFAVLVLVFSSFFFSMFSASSFAANPTLVSNLGLRSAYGVQVVGNYAYLADGGDNGESSALKIINISNPNSPVVTGSLSTFNAQNVRVSGNYAYVADAFYFKIVDISNPSAPTLKGSLSGYTNAFEVGVTGNYVVLANTSHYIQIIDVSNPNSPSVVSTYTPSNTGVYYLKVIGNYVYYGDGAGNFNIVDITNKASPSLVGSIALGSLGSTYAFYGVDVNNNYAYVPCAHTNGMCVLDISTPSSPSLVGRLDNIGTVMDIKVVNNNAYVLTAGDSTSCKLMVIDITNPAAPVSTGSLTIGSDAGCYHLGIDVVGNYVYTGTERLGFNIVDIAIPPTLSETVTPTLSESTTPTLTPTLTISETPTLTTSPTVTLSPSTTPTLTKTSTLSPTITSTISPTMTPTPFPPNLVGGRINKVGYKDTSITFAAAEFIDKFLTHFNTHGLIKVKITSLPYSGILKLSGVDVAIDDEIAVDELNNLAYKPDTNWTGNDYFSWKGSDGILYSLTAANVSITIKSMEKYTTATWAVPAATAIGAGTVGGIGGYMLHKYGCSGKWCHKDVNSKHLKENIEIDNKPTKSEEMHTSGKPDTDKSV